jgi:hypothetical protein
VTGLFGREGEGEGTTVIMIPLPVSKEGKFFIFPAQKDPYFTQKLIQEVFNWSGKDRKGPYFRNVTETFDNIEIIRGKWVTLIAETEKGYMLGFKTNETRFEDIDFSVAIFVDYFDIFDLINNGSPILFPIENASNTSTVPYREYIKSLSEKCYNFTTGYMQSQN